MDQRERAFELYLHDLQDLPLLEPSEEQRLVTHLLAGRAAQLQVASGAVPAGEEARLAQLIAEGARAREALIAAHLRLVIRIARQYSGRGVSLLDLVQEGNLSLIQAADHFDPQHRARFATYAVWWIRHAIAHAVAEAHHPVRLPDQARAKVYRLYRARTELMPRLGREPYEHELAQATGWTVREVRELLPYLQPAVSLSQPLNDEAEQTLADVIRDPVAELELGTVLQAALAAELEPLLGSLSDEEREVVTLRFGLQGRPLRSPQDVAQQLGSSTERVHRLEARALRKLRSAELSDRLQDYVER